MNRRCYGAIKAVEGMKQRYQTPVPAGIRQKAPDRRHFACAKGIIIAFALSTAWTFALLT